MSKENKEIKEINEIEQGIVNGLKDLKEGNVFNLEETKEKLGI